MQKTDIIKQVREKTGAGVMECKKALTESGWDIAKTLAYLKERGAAKAQDKSNREAVEGVVYAYLHGGGRIGVLLEVNVETDFAARSERFLSLVKEIAMQIAACRPRYVNRKDIPPETLADEEARLYEQTLDLGKPGPLVEKIVKGKLEKHLRELCLMEQAYIRDPDKTIKDITDEASLVIEEKLVIRRFTRYEVGDGLNKGE